MSTKGPVIPAIRSFADVRTALQNLRGYLVDLGNLKGPKGDPGPSGVSRDPATSVVSATTFGLSPQIGSDVRFAREGHGHGTPADPVPAHVSAGDPHAQYTLETAFDDHSVRHENGGADEISIAGLSGEAADSQPPKSHDNTAHSTAYQATSEKDSASGYAGLNASSRTTKGADATDDLIVDLATKGLVLKDTQGTPHYWRITISNAGAIVITDVGTGKP